MHGTASAVRTPPPSPSNEPVLVSIVLLKRMPQLIMRDIQLVSILLVREGIEVRRPSGFAPETKRTMSVIAPAECHGCLRPNSQARPNGRKRPPVLMMMNGLYCENGNRDQLPKCTRYNGVAD